MPYCVDCGKKTQEGTRCSYCATVSELEERQEKNLAGAYQNQPQHIENNINAKPKKFLGCFINLFMLCAVLLPVALIVIPIVKAFFDGKAILMSDGIPECKSRDARTLFDHAVKNNAYSNIVKIEVIELTNIKDISVSFPKERLCQAYVVYNTGEKHDVEFSMRKANDGGDTLIEISPFAPLP